MNILNGSVKTITRADSLVLLEIVCGTDIFTSLLLESNESDAYKSGEHVNIIFKETEVMIATPDSKVSARNSFVSPVLDIETGVLLCNITFGFGNYVINAIVTKNALLELQCKKGEHFRWFVKSNEVSIQKI
ncbi:MAG: hypothetical protein IBX43_01255 [Campylobacterales bacterium]|nr:hypothetical protein [Campylobacterales bacterium]